MDSIDKGIKELLATDWDINQPCELGPTLIQRAALRGQDWLVKILIKRGAKLEGAIYQTMTFNHVKTLELLLKGGADIEEINTNKHTPLQAAIVGKKPKLVSLLLKYGANTNVRNKFDRNPLEIAIFKKNNGEDMDEIISILEKYMGPQNQPGQTPS